MEFLAALLGAVIGGALSLIAGIVTTNRSLKGQRELARQAADDERAAAAAASARETAVLMLDYLATMREHLGGMGDVIWRTGSDPIVTDQNYADPPEPPAVRALAALRRVSASHAALLPDAISQRWYELTLLLDEYRTALNPSADDDELRTDATRGRAGDDVARYLAYVQKTLVTFVREQVVLPHADPPILRRADLQPWLAPES
ncbi:MAG: hypothetical protein ABWX57_04990 [Aeromicrobium sp.]